MAKRVFFLFGVIVGFLILRYLIAGDLIIVAG
jgi:hypothetical protein